MLPAWSFLCVRGETIVWMKVQYITEHTSTVVPAEYRRSGMANLMEKLNRLRHRQPPLT